VKSSLSPAWYWLTYPVWIGFCAILFLMLRGAPDPSRPLDAFWTETAIEVSLEALRSEPSGRFDDYEIIHVARARRGELTMEGPRLLVLADRRMRSGLREAVVLELEGTDGSLLSYRCIDPSTARMTEPLPFGTPCLQGNA
jgi:hypothetical protein